MKVAGKDFCRYCYSKNLFDTQDDTGKFITICNDCGKDQEPKPKKIKLSDKMIEIDINTEEIFK